MFVAKVVDAKTEAAAGRKTRFQSKMLGWVLDTFELLWGFQKLEGRLAVSRVEGDLEKTRMAQKLEATRASEQAASLQRRLIHDPLLESALTPLCRHGA